MSKLHQEKKYVPMELRTSIKFPKWQNLTFWHFQVAGWLVFWCADLFIIWMQHAHQEEIISQALDAPLAFLLTLVLRQVYVRLQYKNISIVTLLVLIIFWSTVFTIIWYGLITTIRYFIIGPNYIIWALRYTMVIHSVSYLTPILFGWSVLYYGIKYWRDWESEKKQAQVAISLAQRAQLQMLRYQVNPHFLFNALNSVRALIDEDKKNAKGMITELSEFLRYSLITRDHTEATLKDELDAIQHYLAIEKKRFEDKLEVTFDVEPQAKDSPILSFLIHPFVENAVKYGMKTSRMPLKIRIRASSEDGHLRIEVANTGHWLEPNDGSDNTADGTGTGLENVRARLENAYPQQYNLETREVDGWVRIILEIQKPSGEN